jgi:tRNA(fMet)-specific endonuclease VapC
LAYLIDTNIAIYARDGSDPILSKLAEHVDDVLLSALSLAELLRGVHGSSSDATRRASRLETLLRSIPVLPFDEHAAREYGAIIARCGWVRGRDYDRMIAGHALATGSILVTNNVSDFRDIPDLTLENWIT